MAAKKRAKAKTKTTGSNKRVTVRSKARKAAPQLTSDASAKTRAAILKGIRRVLKEQGVAGDLAEVHVDTTTAALGLAAPCPPNTISRMVCFRRPDGTLVCEERCVPI
jgi:hypothetical protein